MVLSWPRSGGSVFESTLMLASQTRTVSRQDPDTMHPDYCARRQGAKPYLKCQIVSYSIHNNGSMSLTNVSRCKILVPKDRTVIHWSDVYNR